MTTHTTDTAAATEFDPLWQDIDARPFAWYVPERFNIARACVADHPPDDLALVVDDGDGEPARLTFDDLGAASARLAGALRDLGIVRGDRVGVMAPQGEAVAAAHLATYRLGGIVMPMSVHFGPDAIGYRLGHAAARFAVVFAEGFARLEEHLDGLPELEHVLVADWPADDDDVRQIGGTSVRSLASAMRQATPHDEYADTLASDHGLLIYTSGTTGKPKGVLHRHQVALAQMPGMRVSHDRFPQPDDVFWTPADWAWGGGLFDALLPSWLCGRPIVASRRKFDPAWAYDLMARHGVRNCFLPPTALRQLRRSDPPPDGVRLRTIASGGEALGESVLTWAREVLGVEVNEFYGQTEANLLVGNGAGQGEVRPGSMGRAFPGFDIAVLDPDSRPVPDDEEGEIAVRLPHPGAFVEYWREPEKTAEKCRDGWVRTGDLGRKDAQGYLWFSGRADDVISSAGYRIGPTEIEEVLVSHDDVLTTAVIGVPDEVRGEAVAAFVVLREGAEPSEELTTALQTLVKHRLAFYQYPREIHYIDELPTTTTGKVQRVELRRIAADQRDPA